MRIYRFSLVLGVTLFINGCFLNKPQSVQHIVKDFNLGWQGDANHQALFVNIDHSEYGGLKIIEETVFAIAWDQDFIIALQHPNISGTSTPNQQDTIFYMIDIREYTERFWGPKENVYRFDTKADFFVNKREMGVPEMEIKSVEELEKI